MSDEQQLDNSDSESAGSRKSQGYTEMPLADAPRQEEELAPDAAKEVFIATRDEAAPIVEESLLRCRDGREAPSKPRP